ncbi:hypothetical protein [Brevibacillus dissolubilis]|uniref:hypothetical protein n=1 Tax=Brevibacillus dissolubilis TaxID=1844116 RepID=UPI001117976C|nr:hypothetical protein [Brevibacillus dissolubilis]
MTITLSAQAFLILCRLFDGCYDDLKQQSKLEQVVEDTAQELLKGVAYLHEQETPPESVTVELSFQQVFFLQKIVAEMLRVMREAVGQEKMIGWLEECQHAFDEAMK